MNTNNLSGRRNRRRTAVIAVGVAGLLVALIGAGGASAVVGPTDLSLTKADSVDPATKGNNFNYTITVSNIGIDDASGVIVTDTLPSQVDYVSAASSLGTCSRAGQTVTCQLGQVNSGVVATVTIVVKADKTGTASNTANVASGDDTNGANNADTETTVINAAAKTTKTKKGKGKASCAAPTISGTPGNDTLTGTKRADVIRGFAGNDRILGVGGKDLICADRGADTILAGDGDDTVVGGGGNDGIFGEAGNDLLKGKSGNDRLRGQLGDDSLVGGRGRDSCKGGAGADFISGSCKP